MRIDRANIVRIDPARRYAESLLQCQIGAENRLVGGILQQEEIPLLPQGDVLVEPAGKGFPDAHAIGRQAHIGLGGKLLADSAGGIGRRAPPDLVGLEDDDIPHPAFGELVRDRASHDARPNDDRVRHCHSACSHCAIVNARFSSPRVRHPVAGCRIV
jgi:hypothetical protein